MKRYVFGVLLVLVATALQAQENPAPVPPNYERIDKETRRWFGEYRYRSLVRRFERGDTSLTVDHYRCLYYRHLFFFLLRESLRRQQHQEYQ